MIQYRYIVSYRIVIYQKCRDIFYIYHDILIYRDILRQMFIILLLHS